MPEDENDSESYNSSTESNEDDIFTVDDNCLKVAYRVVLFWNHNVEVPSSYITPGSHKNIVVQEDPIHFPHVPDNVKKALASLDVYRDSLRQIMRTPNAYRDHEKFIKAVMLQVSRGVEHLHKCGKIFGTITQDEVFICCSSTDSDVSVVLHNPAVPVTLRDNEADEGGKRSDIRNLAKFYSELLTEGKILDPKLLKEEHMGCSDVGVALHLVQNLDRNPDNVQKVIDHPFFWSENEKIDFICESFDHIKHLKFQMKKIVDTYANDVFGNDWISRLELRTEEKTAIQSTLQRKGGAASNKRPQVNVDTIKNLARKERNHKVEPYIYDDDCLRRFDPSDARDWNKLIEKICATAKEPESELTRSQNCDQSVIGPITLKQPDDSDPYSKESLFDLLRFFRNRRAHYWESKKNIRSCFSSYPNGFWKFFSSRFPNLLPFVYTNKDVCFHNNA